MPGWQIKAAYKRRGFTQWAIAQEAKVSQGTVANCIYRRQTGPAIERVWATLEKILK
jgi:lambda repressor-like predicted transcriptional regulator